MNLKRFDNPKIFADSVMPILKNEEAVNSLMLGVLQAILSGNYEKNEKYMAYTEENGFIASVVLMTLPFGPILYSSIKNDSDSMRLIADDLIKSKFKIDDVVGRKNESKLFAEIYSRTINCGFKLGMNMRLYELKKVNNIILSSGLIRQAELKDTEIIADWIGQFHEETHTERGSSSLLEAAERRIKDGSAFVWEDKKIVSMTLKTRPTNKYVSVSGVLTPKEYRRRGYATSLVYSLSKSLLESGYEGCTLFTDLSNPTSNKIYQDIGYKPICDFDKYKFAKD